MVLSRQPVPQSETGGHMDGVSEITELRKIRLEIIEHKKAIERLEARQDDILEVTATSRPTHRKTLSGRSAAELIRSGGLRQ